MELLSDDVRCTKICQRRSFTTGGLNHERTIDVRELDWQPSLPHAAFDAGAASLAFLSLLSG